MTIDNLNNYSTILTNVFTVIALLYAAIKWFQFSINRIFYLGRKKIIKNVRQFQLFNRNQKKVALKVVKEYCGSILEGGKFYPADEIDLLSSLLGNNQSITYLYSKEELRELAFGYMSMSNNFKKRLFLGADSKLIQDQVLFCTQVADLLFSFASLSPNVDAKIISDGSQYPTENELAIGNLIQYFDFKNDPYAYKLSISWYKEMQAIDSEYELGFDRGTRFPKSKQYYSDSGRFNSKRVYNAVLPTLIETDEPIIKSSVDDRNGEHYLQLSVGESTYSSVEALRKPQNQKLSINKIITMSMIIISRDKKILIPKRSRNKVVESYQDNYMTSVNGNLDIPTRWFGNTDYDEFGLPSFYKAIMREAKEELNLELNSEKIVVHGLVRIFTKDDYGTWVLCMSYQSNRLSNELNKYIESNNNTLGKYETTSFEWMRQSKLDRKLHSGQMMPHLIATYSLFKKYLTTF